MEKFAGTTTEICLKNHHTCGYPVYALDIRPHGNISGLPKWEPHSCEGIYIGQSPSYARSVSLVLNTATDHVSSQFHVVFDDDFSTVPFIR